MFVVNMQFYFIINEGTDAKREGIHGNNVAVDIGIILRALRQIRRATTARAVIAVV